MIYTVSMAKTLTDQINQLGIRALTDANRRRATWHCPYCDAVVVESPRTDHVQNCFDLRDAMIDRIDAAKSGGTK